MRVGAWFTATSAAFAVGYLAIAAVVGARIGNTGLGLFRAVQQNLFGPVQLLTIGSASVFVPYLVRTIKKSDIDAIRESVTFSLLMSGCVGLYGVIMFEAGHWLLERVFGPSFAAATAVVLPMSIAFTLDAASNGGALLLRARALGGRLLVAQAGSMSVRIVAVAILVDAYGLRGAGWGLAIGSGVTVAAMWTQVALAERRRVAASHPVSARARRPLRLAHCEVSEQ